jgi:hypothetical protein
MKTKTLALLVAILTLVLPILATQKFPLNTTFNGPAFSAIFPTPDDSSAGIVKTPMSGTTETDHSPYSGLIYSSSTAGGKAWFGASSVEYTSERGTGSDSLDAVVDASLVGMKAVAVPGTHESTVFVGLFAREVEGVTDTFDTFVRASVVGNHLFLATVIFDKSLHPTKADADEFFNSIHAVANPLYNRT